MHDQLPQRPEDDVRKDSAKRVDDEQRRPGRGQPAAGAEEQAGANGTTDTNHLHLTVGQTLVISSLFLQIHPAWFVVIDHEKSLWSVGSTAGFDDGMEFQSHAGTFRLGQA